MWFTETRRRSRARRAFGTTFPRKKSKNRAMQRWHWINDERVTFWSRRRLLNTLFATFTSVSHLEFIFSSLITNYQRVTLLMILFIYCRLVRFAVRKRSNESRPADCCRFRSPRRSEVTLQIHKSAVGAGSFHEDRLQGAELCSAPQIHRKWDVAHVWNSNSKNLIVLLLLLLPFQNWLEVYPGVAPLDVFDASKQDCKEIRMGLVDDGREFYGEFFLGQSMTVRVRSHQASRMSPCTVHSLRTSCCANTVLHGATRRYLFRLFWPVMLKWTRTMCSLAERGTARGAMWSVEDWWRWLVRS